MKTQIKLLTLGAAITVSGFMASANAAGTNGTATATLIVPLSITEATPMNFGTVAGGTAVGTVVLDLADGRTETGDAQQLGTDGVTAVFDIVGDAAQTYALTFTDGSLVGPGVAMTVDTFTVPGTLPALAGAGVSVPLSVGATLTVGAGQLAGAYSTGGGGTAYTITVNYN